MVKIGLYSLGKQHTIDKYFQIMKLFNLMINDDRFRPCLIFDNDVKYSYARRDLTKLYSNLVDIYDLREISINDIGLDAVIVIDPYSVPPIPYKEWKVPIIYKEYGIAGSEAGAGYLIQKSPYRYSDLIITDNEWYKNLILSKYPTKDIVVGSPAFDWIFDYSVTPQFKNNCIDVLWTPHHSIFSNSVYDNIEGGVYSTFLSYKDYLTSKFLENNPTVNLHVKPHPILSKRYNAYLKLNGVNDTLRRWIKRIKSSKYGNRIFFYEKYDYYELFNKCDVLLNDSISFIQEWLPTIKPMIVLEDENKSKYSEFGEQLIDDCYYRATIDNLQSTFNHALNNYSKLSKRLERCSEYYINYPSQSNSQALLEIIYQRYSK